VDVACDLPDQRSRGATRSNAKASLAHLHIPHAVASKIVASINTGVGTTPPHQRSASAVFAAIQGDFAQSTRIVYLAMAGIMATSFLIAVRRMERGIPTEVTEAIEAEAATEPTITKQSPGRSRKPSPDSGTCLTAYASGGAREKPSR
jgi:hypothetical protein